MKQVSTTLKQVLKEITDVLKHSDSATPELDAEFLVRQVLDKDNSFVIAHPEFMMDASQRRRIVSLAHRRAAGEPMQYISGIRDFWKDTFAVSPAVLIPRPETETLVENGAALVEDIAFPRILDLATGSGCVGLSLLRERPASRVTATDISFEAAKVALKNAHRLGLQERFHVVVGDGLSLFGRHAARIFHLVVSNPPYISTEEYQKLPNEITEWEPRHALVAGEDGLDFFHYWIQTARTLLRPGGHLLMEFGLGQWASLQKILSSMNCFYEVFHDFRGIPRVFHLRES